MTKKAILWIIAAVIVVGGVWWWVSAMQSSGSPAAYAPSETSASSTPANGISANDNSNAALQTDLTNVDSEMNGFSSDNASVDQGMNDQPVPQEQM